MEYPFIRPLCRLCLCYDVSLVDIFKHDASQEYNLTSVILELLELKVSEEDGYPKALCSACLKTIINFKNFKKECQQAMIMYDKNIRPQEIPDVNRRSQKIHQSQQESSKIILDHMKEEKCMSPGVLYTDFEGNQESNPVEHSSKKRKPLKCLECSKEFSRKWDYTRHSRVHKSVTFLSSEQNPESRSTRSTHLKQKEVNKVTLNINLLDDGRRRKLDLESKSYESNGTTSVELFPTVTSSKLDKSKEDEIECIQQGDSLIASEIQSGGMMTMEKCHSFDKEEDVSWKLRKSGVKKGKHDEGDGMLTHYNCDHCSKVFNDIPSLNMHLSLHERDVSFEGKEVTSTNAEVNKNAKDKVGKFFHNCGVCGRRFKRKDDLKVHMRTHSGEKPYKCRICHKMFRHKSTHNKHVVIIHEYYRCIYCKKSFPVKDKLAEHIQECRIKRGFRCNRCNMYFDDHLSLNEHLRTHTTEKVFKCHYCNKCFSRIHVLSVHERIHSGEKHFICSVCRKSFTDKSNFIAHLRIHANDKRHKCGYCDKSFVHSGYLKVHERTHTKEKPFWCSYCVKSFSNRSYFKKHEQIHQGEKKFGCSFCGKHFSQRKTLKDHEAVHLKIKLFECSICKKSFSSRKYLKQHEAIHLNIKPFECSICKKSFCLKKYLRNHMKVHMK